jgi:acetylornithine deacetylase/succinyl-diaminopimelate desuccinylase-like protein
MQLGRATASSAWRERCRLGGESTAFDAENLMTANANSSRSGAIRRAEAYLDSGAFEVELARRVAIRTESQALPGSRSELDKYVAAEMIPSFEKLGFTCRTFDNPVAGQGPVLLATRMEDPKLPTVLGYGHGDVIRGQEVQWTKGKGPWTLARDGERLYGRGTADNKCQHTINMAAMAAVMAERGGKLGFNAKYIIEMAEETGSAGLDQVLLANKDAFAATVLVASDGPRATADRPTLVLGNRGAITFDLVCKLRDGGHHSGNWGGLLADPAVILAHSIATFVGPRGGLRLKAWLPPPIAPHIKAVLRDVMIDGGDKAPTIDAGWGEPGLTGPEKVYAWNSFAVLAMTSGNPDAPVNAIAPYARARCQLRYVVGTKVDDVLPALRRHLDVQNFKMVEIVAVPDVGKFEATRTDPDHPWAQWAVKSFTETTNAKPAVIPSSGGGVPNDLFQNGLGMPTLWVPHSYPGCSQHAPDEHILLPVAKSALRLMAGLYWDLGEGGTPG